MKHPLPIDWDGLERRRAWDARSPRDVPTQSPARWWVSRLTIAALWTITTLVLIAGALGGLR